MSRTLVVAGRIEAGQLVNLYVAPDALIGHYVLDGEYVHSGKCLTTFLEEQRGYYEKPEDVFLDDVWTDLVSLGAFTVEQRDDDEYVDPNADCIKCGKPINPARWFAR